MCCKCRDEIEQDLTNTKKKMTFKALVLDLSLFSGIFFQVWKIAGQISRLFQEFKTLYEPW